MSTPFIVLMLVLAAILVWAVVEQRLFYRQIDKVREREKALKKDLRDYRARQLRLRHLTALAGSIGGAV